ncbi:97 [Lymphocystis disease virus 1]|uniref:97 n=1 Tax=Fish lymphocystis disease virus TaxID=36363 RepID=UPI0000161EFA|nr:97 [Lymphocystis disease virus 1]
MSVCVGSKKDGYVKLSDMNKIKLTQLTAPQLACIPEMEDDDIDETGGYTATADPACECDSLWTTITKSLNMSYIEMLLAGAIVIIAIMIAYKLFNKQSISS